MSLPEDIAADLLALVASGRSDSLVDVALGDASPETLAAFRQVREATASLALAEPPVSPSPDLRSRILRSLAETHTAARRAVLVLDMQNDHLLPGRPLEVPRARDIVPALAARLDRARREETPVVYVVDEHDPDDSDLDVWGTHNVRGTDGAKIWPAISPLPQDKTISKVTYSAFTGSDLGRVLGSLGVDTLVLTGCLTEIGILATATDALQRGYAVEIPRETQAGATSQSEEAVLAIVRLLHPYGPARKALLAGARSSAA